MRVSRVVAFALRSITSPCPWIVDPEAEQIDAWPFAAGPVRPERYTDRVPVRVGARVVGTFELTRIFERAV